MTQEKTTAKNDTAPPLNAMVQNFKLEQFLEVLGTHHQLKAARRLSSAKKITSKAEAERQIRLTLNEPKNVDDLIARLHPTELALLQEARRYGGVVSGWTLYVYARLRDLNPPTQSMNYGSTYLFQAYSPATYPGASLIWSLLADGLLFPAQVPNPWLTKSGFSYYGPSWELFPNASGHLLVADPRLLARLPLAPRLPAPALPAQHLDAQPMQGLGALLNARLCIAEVLRVAERHGGIAVTKSREPSRAGIKRLLKDLSALPDPELWLGIVMGLGLLVPDRKGEHIVPYRAGWQEVIGMDARQFAALLLNILPTLDTPEDQAYRLANPVTLRACLLELLKELSGPVRESAFKKQVEQVIPGELRASLTYDYYGREGKQEVGKWNAWFSATLRGVLVDFGLLTVQENADGTGNGDAVLIPNPTLHAEVGAEPASGPAWVLQPNFELLVYPAHLQPQHFSLLAAAEAVRLGEQTATYRLTRDSVYAALEGGLNPNGLLGGLEAGSATPLAPAMRRTVQDWAARRERLVMHQHATLLEYPSTAERDQALRKGGAAVGETFLLLEAGRKLPPGTPALNYHVAPTKPLTFKDTGEFTLSGPLDLTGRALLAGRVTATDHGHFRFVPPSTGTFYPRNLIVELEARSSGRLPDTLRFQLSVWSALTPSPSVANLTIVQHPQAQTLARHPALKPMLGPALSPTLLTVQAGQEADFQAALHDLGLAPQQQLTLNASAGEELVVIQDTRKKRSFIEDATKNGHNLLIHYHQEKDIYSGWYGSRTTQGKLRKETVRPQRIDRQGSTPYLWAQVLDSGEDVRIRIAYITGMAIR